MNRFVRTFFVLVGLACTSTGAGAFSGNLSNAIFVDTATGSDGYAGTMAQPKATIGGALSIATSGKNIYVSKGTYSEDVQMASGVSLYGQYDQASNWTQDAANTTIINGSANPVMFTAVSGETHFEGFQVQAANAAVVGQSSYAVHIDSSPGPIFIRYNTLMAGTGGPGLLGGNGVAGSAVGGNGGNGAGGSCDSSTSAPGGIAGTSACGSAGGRGGNGSYGPSSGLAGQSGTGGAAGGFGGDWGNQGSPGGSGSAGANGTNGANATASSSAIGSVISGLYTPVSASTGGSGADGNGGGGGGGGGGQDGTFVIDGTGNGGGGGGGGGCGATLAGTSGTGGGGSFAVFASASAATVDSNYLVMSQGGAGGAGGNGAGGSAGGTAGSGGTVCSGGSDDEVGAGGNGGKGGNGGSSGAGAGGPGGPAVAIFNTSGTVTVGTNRYSLPGAAPAGNPGSGGSSGLVGIVQHGYPSDFTDPGPPMLAIADTSFLMSYTGINFVAVPVSLGPVTNAYVTVHYQTVDGTAIAGTNYTATSGDLSLAPWATAQTIRVPVLGALSLPKSFSVQLSSPMNAGITTSSATVTIDYFSDVIFRSAFD